jgi:hypothetical protein
MKVLHKTMDLLQKMEQKNVKQYSIEPASGTTSGRSGDRLLAKYKQPLLIGAVSVKDLFLKFTS